MTGFGVAASLGYPDAGILSSTDNLQQVRRGGRRWGRGMKDTTYKGHSEGPAPPHMKTKTNT
jgi:hypothetical protein